MAAGGKGHAPRPFSVSADEYANNFDRIFGARRVASGVSKIPESGSCPDAPANCDDCREAVYVDNESGREVTAEWWPGDPIDA